MNNPGYIANIKIPDLGMGGALALWGFRAIAAGQNQCVAITTGYEDAFGRHSDDVLALMHDYARMLGTVGRRRIGLGCSGCGNLTADELSIVAVLAAAQLSGDAATTAHLTWLLGKTPSNQNVRLVSDLAEYFLLAGMTIQLPDIALSDWSATRDIEAEMHLVGSA